MTKSPSVSIVVLNWNGLEDTKECIKSLHALDYPNYEIIVVDNGSSDGSKEYLKKTKDIVFIDLPSNTGFTGGHIEGYKKSKGDYVALLNNDAVVAKNWLKEILRVFEKHDDAAAVGSKGYMWNDEFPAHNTTSPFYSYQEVDPNGGYTRTLMTGESVCRVDSISGAALVVDKSKVNEVGYLDDSFFLYYEETDLLARLIRKGYSVYYAPNAHIWHKIAASTEGGAESDMYLKQMHRNRFYYAYKNFDPENLKRFLSSYKRELLISRLKLLRGRFKDQEARCRMVALKEINQNMPYLKEAREKTQSLGPTYNKRLGAHYPDDVTIVIPCYNYADYVAEAIDSALNQSHKPAKILVINDGSTDKSIDVINKYKNNPLVEIINKKNEGVIATKNLGIELSKTYWTMFLDADDKIEDDTLRTMLKAARDGAHYDVVYSDMRMFGAIDDIFRAKPFVARSFLNKNYINNTTLINTTCLKRSGGYKKAMSGGLEDWELYVTLLEQGAKFKYVPQTLVWYRQHGQDVVSRNTEVQDINKGRRLFATIKSLHPALYKRHGRRRYSARLIMAVFVLFQHPLVIFIAIKSTPGALKQAARHILHNIRVYINEK